MTNLDLQQIDKLLQKRLKNFATKDDLKSMEEKINKKLDNFATKKDLKEGLDDLLAHIVSATDKSKVEKRVFEALEKRVDKIEETLQISAI